MVAFCEIGKGAYGIPLCASSPCFSPQPSPAMKTRQPAAPKAGHTPVDAPQAIAFQPASAYPVAPESAPALEFPAVQRYAVPQDQTQPALESHGEMMPHAEGGVVQGIFKTSRIEGSRSDQAQPILRAIEIVRRTILKHRTLKFLSTHPKIMVEFWPGSAGTAGTFIYPADKDEAASIKGMSKADLIATCTNRVGIICNIGFNFNEGKEQHAGLALGLGEGLNYEFGYAQTQDESYWASVLVHEIAVHIGPYASVIKKLADGDPSQLNEEDFKLLGAGGEQVEHAQIYHSAGNFQSSLYGQLLTRTAAMHSISPFANQLSREALTDMYHQYALADVARYVPNGTSNPDFSRTQANYKDLWARYQQSKPRATATASTAAASQPSNAMMEVKQRAIGIPLPQLSPSPSSAANPLDALEALFSAPLVLPSVSSNQSPPSLSSAPRPLDPLEALFSAPLNVPPVDPNEAQFSVLNPVTGFLDTDHAALMEYRRKKRLGLL